MNQFTPFKYSSKRYSLPWITKDINRINKKQRLYNKAKKFQRETDGTSFRKYRKATQKKIQSEYWKYLAHIIDPEQDKEKQSFWHYIKSLNKDSTGISPLKDKGILHTDSKSKADILSNQFQSVFTNENLTNLPQLPNQNLSPQMPPIHITVRGIEKLLKELKPNKAQCPDNIPARILKEVAFKIAPILTIIFQKSINSGTPPSDWLKAHIGPIHKKDDRTIASNYRHGILVREIPSPVYHAKFLNMSHPHQSINILKNTIFSLTDNTASDLGVPVKVHCSQLSMT